jgi:serine/threonine protein kinase, bacterial
MTDGPQGHGWWQAADLKWYPPEEHGDYVAPLPLPPTPPSQPPGGGSPPRRSRSPIVVMGVVTAVAVLVAAGVLVYVFAFKGSSTSPQSQTAQPAAPSVQTVVPLPGLHNPRGVAVDGGGNVYVTDVTNQVTKLLAGSGNVTAVPFTGIGTDSNPGAVGVAVDSARTVYVADPGNARVLTMAAGAYIQNVLPIPGNNSGGTGSGLPYLVFPNGVAVDGAGTVYVSDDWQVVKVAAGSSTPTILPFPGGLHKIGLIAVDSADDVFLAVAGNNEVLKVAAGSGTSTVLPFTGLNFPAGVAVDSAGNVYVTDSKNNRVVKLAAGSSTQSVLPFTGLNGPIGVAVDGAGNLYVADSGNNRVLKLAAG